MFFYVLFIYVIELKTFTGGLEKYIFWNFLPCKVLDNVLFLSSNSASRGEWENKKMIYTNH